jgi:hypothetical protein
VLLWLLISDGYRADLGFAGSLFYTMNFYDAKWFCEYEFSSECWHIFVKTKYFVVASLLSATYGCLMWNGLVSDPFLGLKNWFVKVGKKLKDLDANKTTY